jgi:hypothetical protein
VSPGDSARLDLIALTRDGRAVTPTGVRWHFLDHGTVAPTTSTEDDTLSLVAHIAARTVGEARIVAEIPGWRSDTVVVVSTSTQPLHIADRFEKPSFDARWLPLGRPLPVIGRLPNGVTAAFPNGDLEWDSGLLLRQSLELRPGLRVRVRIHAPFVGRPTQATMWVGFAAGQGTLDSIAPRLNPLVFAAWDGASGNLTYTVGRETSSEATTAVASADSHEIEIRVNDDRSVVFSVDGSTRWTSSLNFLGDVQGTAVRLWIGGRATGSSVAVSDFSLDQPGRGR